MKWVRFGKKKQHHRSIGRRLRRLMTLNTRIEAQRRGFDSEKEEGANIVQFSPQGGNGTVLAPSDVVAVSANFEDRSLWKYNALSLKNHNLIAVPSGSTENRYGVEPLTDSSCPYFSRVKSRISYVDRGHPKDCVNLRCGVELTNIFAATPTIN